MDRRTIDSYNKKANEYQSETADFWDQFPRTFLDKFLELSGNKIIDVGCGPGRDALLMKKAGKRVTCLDASIAMVKLCEEKGFNSILGDFNHLPFEDGTFDGVWSYTSLLHVPKKDTDIPLKEIHRVLKRSGIFGLGLIQGNSEEYKESMGADLPRWFSYYEKEEIENLCQKHGFELIYFETFKLRSRNYINFIFRKVEKVAP